MAGCGRCLLVLCARSVATTPSSLALYRLSYRLGLKLGSLNKLFEKALCQYNRPTLTDNRTRFVNTSSKSEYLDNLTAGTADLDAIYARCEKAYPEFDLSREDFKEAVIGAVDKYLVGFAKEGEIPTVQEIRK